MGCPLIDIGAEPDPRAAAEAWMKTDLARVIEPEHGPLFGYALFQASETRFFWYARYHHIVMDSFGMWLVARHVADVYTQLCSGAPNVRDIGFGSLRSLVEDDAVYRTSSQFERDRNYWKEDLDARPGASTLSGHALSNQNGFLRRSTFLRRRQSISSTLLASRTGTSLARVLAAIDLDFFLSPHGI